MNLSYLAPAPPSVRVRPAASAHDLDDLAAALTARRPSTYERLAKPLLDRTIAALAIVVLAPVALVISLAVLVSLGRPVYFRQRRVGQGGTRFFVIKFRTMRPDRRGYQEDRIGEERRRTHKHRHDPRLTRVGRFLRVTSLDELPQLWNVLRGEMSLVGPRPEVVAIVQRYRPWAHARHLVRPGLTGLWQVTERGRDPAVEMHHRADVDLAYVAGLSLGLDLRILARTLPSVLVGRGH